MTNDTQKMIAQFEKQLAALKAQVQKNEATLEGKSTTKQRDAIMAALPKSGGITVADLCKVTGLSKGTAWRRIHELNTEARVWLRLAPGAKAGDRERTIVYHADAIAT